MLKHIFKSKGSVDMAALEITQVEEVATQIFHFEKRWHAAEKKRSITNTQRHWVRKSVHVHVLLNN